MNSKDNTRISKERALCSHFRTYVGNARKIFSVLHTVIIFIGISSKSEDEQEGKREENVKQR